MSDENNMPKGRERPTGPCDCGRIEHGRHHADCPASAVSYSDKYPAAPDADENNKAETGLEQAYSEFGAWRSWAEKALGDGWRDRLGINDEAQLYAVMCDLVGSGQRSWLTPAAPHDKTATNKTVDEHIAELRQTFSGSKWGRADYVAIVSSEAAKALVCEIERLRQLVPAAPPAVGEPEAGDLMRVVGELEKLAAERALGFVAAAIDQIPVIASAIRRLAAGNAELTEQNKEWECAFDLFDACSKRASEEWKKAHPEQADVWPDGCDKMVWLMTELSAAREEAKRLREALQGVVRVADRKTIEFDAARAALSAPAGSQE